MIMEYLIVLVMLVILGMIFYNIQDNIGKDQVRDWQDFIKEHPNWFKKPDELKSNIRKEQ